jgi:glycosyltransferase involved in cell wall biosynthesis
MKGLILIPCWGRPEVVSLCVRSLRNYPPPFGHTVLFVLSPEDPHYEILLRLVRGFNHMDTDNFPLGRKMNRGLERALQFDWDYLIGFGSDNVWTQLLWDYLDSSFKKMRPFFGVNNVYFYNPDKDEAVFCEGFHINWEDRVSAIGPGRCIRRDIVERAGFLWGEHDQFGMDGYSCNRIMKKTGARPDVIDTGKQAVICNITTPTCLTGWHEFDDRGDRVDADWVRSVFGLDRAYLLGLNTFDRFHNAVLKSSQSRKNKREAFERVNDMHRQQTGELRYSNYESYKVQVTKRHGSKNDAR